MRSPNGIQAILFDFDGTLKHHLPTGGEFFTEHAVSLGLNVTAEDRRRTTIWEHYYFANSPEIQADQKKFKGEGDEFWSHFAHRRLTVLGCPAAIIPELGPQLSDYMRDSYRPTTWVPEELHIVLPEMRKAGYTLGVVSNRDFPYQSEIDSLGMEGYFHFSLAGGEVNSKKPEPGIFQAALERAGVSAEQALYIGDNYFADVVGARRAGLRPVLYDPKGLFHEPGCPVISTFDELTDLLK